MSEASLPQLIVFRFVQCARISELMLVRIPPGDFPDLIVSAYIARSYSLDPPSSTNPRSATGYVFGYDDHDYQCYSVF